MIDDIFDQVRADAAEGKARKAQEREARYQGRDRYLDQKWQARARAFLAAHKFCLGCRTIGRTTKATIADHVVPVSRSSADFFLAPLQPLCNPCHNSVKRKLEHMFRRGEIKADALRMDSDEAARLLGPTLGCDPVTGLPNDPRHPWHRPKKV